MKKNLKNALSLALLFSSGALAVGEDADFVNNYLPKFRNASAKDKEAILNKFEKLTPKQKADVSTYFQRYTGKKTIKELKQIAKVATEKESAEMQNAIVKRVNDNLASLKTFSTNLENKINQEESILKASETAGEYKPELKLNFDEAENQANLFELKLTDIAKSKKALVEALQELAKGGNPDLLAAVKAALNKIKEVERTGNDELSTQKIKIDDFDKRIKALEQTADPAQTYPNKVKGLETEFTKLETDIQNALKSGKNDPDKFESVVNNIIQEKTTLLKSITQLIKDIQKPDTNIASDQKTALDKNLNDLNQKVLATDTNVKTLEDQLTEMKKLANDLTILKDAIIEISKLNLKLKTVTDNLKAAITASDQNNIAKYVGEFNTIKDTIDHYVTQLTSPAQPSSNLKTAFDNVKTVDSNNPIYRDFNIALRGLSNDLNFAENLATNPNVPGGPSKTAATVTIEANDVSKFTVGTETFSSTDTDFQAKILKFDDATITDLGNELAKAIASLDDSTKIEILDPIVNNYPYSGSDAAKNQYKKFVKAAMDSVTNKLDPSYDTLQNILK